MIEEKSILPELCYSLLDIDYNENQLSLIIDYELGLPHNIDELELEYEFLILENPKIEEDTINKLKDLIDSEVEIDLEVENRQKRIRIWDSAAEIHTKINCENYRIVKQPLSRDQWIKRYKKLIEKLYHEINNSERKRIQIRDFNENAEHCFRNELDNTIKKLDFFKKTNKENKLLELKKELLSKFLGLKDKYFD